ncbi:glycoside hydrolase family 95 protein [Poriferisphaera sp. WC338]|uniref:glycoside hydrolase family 95 protein n=1 Tax=Poriferisphaera sp. WC338 TaxID=3425129 RepID=UPI003D81B5AD
MQDPKQWSLWYRQPAEKWVEALPIGNGKLGAMIFGNPAKEHIQLNEETIWAGPPVPVAGQEFQEAMKQAKMAWKNGEIQKAHTLIADALPERIYPRSYQTLGDIWIDQQLTGNTTDYKRTLSLNTGVCETTFTNNGVQYIRRAWASMADNVVVIHIAASKPGSISATIKLDRPGDFVTTYSASDDSLLMNGQAQHDGKHLGVKWEAQLRAINKNGTAQGEENHISVKNADEVCIILSASTDYNIDDPGWPRDTVLHGINSERIEIASAKSVEQLLSDHTAIHEESFSRVGLSFGNDEKQQHPTDERLEAVQNGAEDLDLIALHFHYGRYLLLCSSHNSLLPANLQGIWQDKLVAQWNSDFHININIQMNYWMAEVVGLGDCHDAFLRMTEHLVPDGRRTAKEVYGCRGFAAHHTTDAWFFTSPFGNPQFGMWPHGAAWCTSHFMEHYRFTQDQDFLKDRALPILKEAALFYLDYMEKDEKGQLVCGLDSSPENRYKMTDGSEGSLAMGCTMSQQLVVDVFSNLLEAADVLDYNDGVITEVRDALPHVARTELTPDGRIAEWPWPMDDALPGHRHISHLYELHPAGRISPQQTPELAGGARKTLEDRLAHGGGHTGWSLGWLINFYARLHDGDETYNMIMRLLREKTLKNLFDIHPPFQIDGNLGAPAGVAEMLIQSHGNEIILLPALPSTIPNGEIFSFRARGGFEISFSWADGKLTSATVLSKHGNTCTIRTGTSQTLSLKHASNTEAAPFSAIAFETQPNTTYELQT